MKIITIKGNQNSGKTTLIKYAFDNLKHDGAEILEYKVSGHLQDDFTAIILWRGIKVYIQSLGDINDETDEGQMSWIKDGVKNAEKLNADVLINAFTSILDEKDYLAFLSPKIPCFINVLKQIDGEEMTIQRQKKYFKELLPELMKIV
ncbi:MAG: hypothetical protein IJ158_12040 [Treponema sp.]|nr:hypothetical protein [Treponema sp.]